ncbi:hypothetical protein PLO_1533 [Pediococcus acidilactici NGRI 0510Q]|nr:hypothetical protein PLO_1533 [Pediococcus acidilactici NGRI 0510Q]
MYAKYSTPWNYLITNGRKRQTFIANEVKFKLLKLKLKLNPNY